MIDLLGDSANIIEETIKDLKSTASGLKETSNGFLEINLHFLLRRKIVVYLFGRLILLLEHRDYIHPHDNILLSAGEND